MNNILKQNKRNAIAFYKMSYEGNPKKPLIYMSGPNTFNITRLEIKPKMNLNTTKIRSKFN